MIWIVAHWRMLAVSAGVLISGIGGWTYGHRVGYRAGYSAGIADAPRCPVVKSEVKVEPSEQKCTSKAEIKYVYRTVPSPAKGCPVTVVPVPEVTYESDSTGKQAGADARTEVVPTVGPPVRSSEPPRDPRSGPNGRWRASGLVGLGASGLEVGASASYRLLGPVNVGVYTRVPTHDVGRASGGVSVGLEF